MLHAIGLVEFLSIARGIEASDLMAKTAEVQILVSKTICPGKYIVLVGGDIASVTQSVKAARALDESNMVDHFLIPNIHPSVLPAIAGGNSVVDVQALGVIETYSVASTIEAADAAVKAAKVEPVRMHLAFGIGGKSYVVISGEVADVEAGVRVGSEVAGDKGMLVHRVVIPRPHKQVIEHLM
ncbi:BMC domain-containing protein [Pseudothauera rhizosphaerae]|uniref:BMC domain-containing protein n=1 Tax=Pseudothauera rhizosphaerae TaxID=2565932 RepID=A0A4S4AIW4_9RHOO|nr:BMC domain-containing protein [Pseudothauera rhizosphaerae]THF59316.1 BMC domain-containing protein [Pseudothauera rhizosphaerae]